MLQTPIHWAPSPVLLDLGLVQVRWYGLLFALGFMTGYWIVAKIYAHEKKPVTDLDSLLTYLIIGTLIGARLGHVIFYEPGFFFSHPLEILMIHHGGLASHGGAIGVLTATYLYCKKHKDQPFLWLLDRLMPAIALWCVFTRLGNLMNSEMIGRPTDLPWGFIFPKLDQIPRHPTQLYESFSYLFVFLFLSGLYLKKGKTISLGLLTGWFFVLAFGLRFVMEFFKIEQVEFEKTMWINMGQILSVIPFAGGLVLLWRSQKLSKPFDKRGSLTKRSK